MGCDGLQLRLVGEAGPGYFPFGLGVLLAILGAAVLFKALTIETDGGEPIGAFPWRPLIIILLAVACSAFCCRGSGC